MSRILTNFHTALATIIEQWQRAALTALGVMVGSVAVILLISIAKGVQADVAGQVEGIGVNVLVVIPGRISGGDFSPNMIGQSYLKEEDAIRLARVPGVLRVAPWTFVGGGLRRGQKVADSILVATTPNWFAIHDAKLVEGRVMTSGDDTSDVCVIGAMARRQLFGSSQAVGQPVSVNGHPFTVVGVTHEAKSESSLFSMGGFENLVYVPYHRMMKLLPAAQTDRIMIQVSPDTEPKQLIKRLDAVLGQRLDRQQFQVLTQEDLLGLVYKLMGILTWLLTGLTSIALFVGGVGIMAIMLMSVGERTKEIGIRKTVGARSSDLFWQFLAESIAISVSGGTVGLLLSYLACLGLYYFTPVKPMVTTGTVALSFAVSVGLGAVFGLIPAMRAARREPVDALRRE